MLAPFSTRYWTASTLPLIAARWSGVPPSCAQASQARGNDTQRYAAPLTHVVRGLDVGALLHQVPDRVHTATLSCTMERRASVLCTSKSGGANYTNCCTGVLTHPICGLDVGAVVDELTQLEHVTSLGGFNKLFVHSPSERQGSTPSRAQAAALGKCDRPVCTVLCEGRDTL